jgi:hypothetical protein
MRRLLRHARTARRCLAVHSVAQLLVPVSALDALDLTLQPVQMLLLGPDLVDHLGAPCPVQLLDQLGHQVIVLQRFLHGGQRGHCGLPLPRVLAMLCVAVAALFQLDLSPQALEIEAAQGIRTQPAGLEELVRRDVWVGLQQLRRLAEGILCHAIALEALEDEERFEGGVGGDASCHAPG